MKQNLSQELLKDKETQQLLKEMILEKANRYDELLAKIKSQKEIDKLLNENITPETIHVIIKSEVAKDEMILLKRDLSVMCYTLNENLNKIPKDTKWKRAYDYATQIVRIEDVINNFLGITNLKRNIKCPFHKDKSPSLKVYTDNNKFVCFGCGARGSPIDFVMQYKNCSFKEAVLYISNL
jgi:hypothetical protein